MSKRVFRLSLILMVLTIFVSACSFPWSKKIAPISTNSVSDNASSTALVTSEKVYNNKLKKFNDYSELSQFLSDNNVDNGNSALTFKTGVNNELSSDNTPNNYIGTVPSSALSISGDGLNIIKASGDYVYALARNELFIIKNAATSEAQVLSKIIFKSRPQAVLLSGKFLIVYGEDTQLSSLSFYQDFRRKNSYTFLKIFDLSDPANPKQTRDLDFEGSYLSVQTVGDYVYFLTAIPGTYLAGEPLVPRVLENGQVLPSVCSGASKCFSPEVYYFDIPYNSYNLVSLTSVNLQDNTEALNGQVYITNDKQNFYLTPSSLNITYNLSLNSYDLEKQTKRTLIYSQLTKSDQDQIDKIEASSDFILNNNEKNAKVAQIIDRFLLSLGASDQATWQATIASSTSQALIAGASDNDKTLIYKMAITNGKLVYRAFGEVRGSILNKSAWDESGDYLRLVTVSDPLSLKLKEAATNHYTNVYVLGPDLQELGGLENLATKELIQNVRFLGNRVYLVTVKASDPLFVINLNDPTKPAVLGAVQVPGVSNYLQPLDANGNKFMVLSHEGEISYSDGTNAKGLTWSLFDFSDLSKPQELSSFLIGASGSNSFALQDYRTLFYSPNKNLLSIPVTLNNDAGHLNFSGSMIFSLNNDKIDLKGKIDHSSGGNFAQADIWDGFDYYNNTVKANLILNDNLITFSNKFLKINNLTDFKSVSSLELTTSGDDYMITPVDVNSSQASSTASSSSLVNNTNIDSINSNTLDIPPVTTPPDLGMPGEITTPPADPSMPGDTVPPLPDPSMPGDAAPYSTTTTDMNATSTLP